MKKQSHDTLNIIPSTLKQSHNVLFIALNVIARSETTKQSFSYKHEIAAPPLEARNDELYHHKSIIPNTLKQSLVFKIISFCLLFCLTGCFDSEKQVVNVYNWANNLDSAIIEAFEQETGIKVNYDIYESNDVLEAKLLTGSTGYDIVFPSLFPYAARQMEAGVYEKLDLSKLPHFNQIDPHFIQEVNIVPHAGEYLIPYYWSVTGIGYNAKKVKEILGYEPDSLAEFFSEDVLSKLSPCGIGVFEEAVDLISLMLLTLGYAPDSKDPAQIKQAARLLAKVKPYIRQFGSFRPVVDLVMEDHCMVVNWLGMIKLNMHKIHNPTKKSPIKFILPKEGGTYWLDCIGILKDAPNKENAYKFIDFILRPENAAKFTEKTFYATTIPAAEKHLTPQLREAITLTPDERKRMFPVNIYKTADMRQYQDALNDVLSSSLDLSID